MAAGNSDQESGLLPSDEGSPNATPPAGRLPMKALLAVGLCIFAAGLAGAVVVGRPAARAPTKIWHPWAAVGLHEFKYMSEECQDLLEALEEEAEEQGRTHEVDSLSGETLDCKKSEQVCTYEVSMYGENHQSSKCFPTVCKQENIFKEMEDIFKELPAEAQLSGLDVSCSSSGEGKNNKKASTRGTCVYNEDNQQGCTQHYQIGGDYDCSLKTEEECSTMGPGQMNDCCFFQAAGVTCVMVDGYGPANGMYYQSPDSASIYHHGSSSARMETFADDPPWWYLDNIKGNGDTWFSSASSNGLIPLGSWAGSQHGSGLAKISVEECDASDDNTKKETRKGKGNKGNK